MSDNEYPDEYLDENGNEYQEEEPKQERGELRPCPFCGSKNTTLDYFEISCPQELGTLVLCGDCGSYSTSVDRWNTRPIEDALNARIAELEEFIGKLIEAGESEDSPMPAVWLELVNDWKEREG